MTKVLSSELIQRDPDTFLFALEKADAKSKEIRSLGKVEAFRHYKFLNYSYPDFSVFDIYRRGRLGEEADLIRKYSNIDLSFLLIDLLVLQDVISFLLENRTFGALLSESDLNLGRSLVKERKDKNFLDKMTMADRMFRCASLMEYCDVGTVYVDNVIIKDLDGYSKLIKFVTFLDELDYGIIKYYKSDTGKLFGEYYRSNSAGEIGQIISIPECG